MNQNYGSANQLHCHRHISHLFALFPGTTICPEKTSELAEAARKTLELRLTHGGGHTGWSRAWIINFYARLGDSKQSYFHFKELLVHSTYPNLSDAHPPFQIDGNFGALAAVAHMFLQSSEDTVHLLKALPDEWPEGSIEGLRAKGGLVVDISWSSGQLTKVKLDALADYNGTVVYKNSKKVVQLRMGESIIISQKGGNLD